MRPPPTTAPSPALPRWIDRRSINRPITNRGWRPNPAAPAMEALLVAIDGAGGFGGDWGWGRTRRRRRWREEQRTKSDCACAALLLGERSLQLLTPWHGGSFAFAVARKCAGRAEEAVEETTRFASSRMMRLRKVMEEGICNRRENKT